MLISPKILSQGHLYLSLQISGHCGLARLTHEMNHHSFAALLLFADDHLFTRWLLVTLEVTTVATCIKCLDCQL